MILYVSDNFYTYNDTYSNLKNYVEIDQNKKIAYFGTIYHHNNFNNTYITS